MPTDERFTVVRGSYRLVTPAGPAPLPWPGHADSIIAALRAHGGSAYLSERQVRSYDGRDRLTDEIMPVTGGWRNQSSASGYLNAYLVERGLATGVLYVSDGTDTPRGTIHLNEETAELYDAFDKWRELGLRESRAQYELARCFEIPNREHRRSYTD